VLLPFFLGNAHRQVRRWAFFLFTNAHWRGILLVIPAGSWWFPHGVPFYTVEFYFFLHRGALVTSVAGVFRFVVASVAAWARV
jgi:hypothetical protein